MKFGKYLLQRHLDLPEYADYFIDYKALKKLIKRLSAPGGISDPQEAGINEQPYERLQDNKATFFFQLERELEKVQQFYEHKEADLEARLDQLEQKRHVADQRAAGRNSVIYISLYEGLQRFRRDLDRLEQFVDLNGTGFAKVLKKWDKRSRSHTKELYLSRAIEVQPMFHREVLVRLSDRSNALLLELEAGAEGGVVYSSTPATRSEPGADEEEISDDLYYEFVNFAVAYDPKQGGLEATEAMAGWVSELQLDHTRITRVFLRALGSDATDAALMALLDSGSVDTTATDEIAGKTALHLCVGRDSGRELVFEALLACPRPPNVNHGDSYGRTPLHIAAIHNRRRFVSRLLEKGADINARDHDNFTPLYYSIFHNWDGCVAQLLDAGAQTQGWDAERYYVPLNFACQRGSYSSVKLLLAKRPDDPMVADAEGLYPLHIAARAGYNGLVDLLVAAQGPNVNVDQLDKLNEWTPLIYAAAEGHPGVVKALLSANADWTILDEKGRSALFYAAVRGTPACLQLLASKLAPGQVDISRDTTAAAAVAAAAAEVSSKAMPPQQALGDMDLTSSEEPLDLDGIPDLALPPPILPLQRYGHNFLDSKKVVLQVSHITAHFNQDRKVLSAGRLILTTSGTRDSIPRNIALPVPDRDAVQTFQVDSLAEFAISFEILPTYGTRLLAKASALPYVFTDNDNEELLNSADRASQGAQRGRLPLVDALLRPVGSLEFLFLVVKPYPGKPLEISKYDTYWKSTTSAAPSDVSTMLSFVTASSLMGAYHRIPVVLTRDLVPVVHDGLHMEFGGGVKVAVPGFMLSDLQRLRPEVRTLADVLRDPETPPKLDISVPFPTYAELRINNHVPVRWPHMNAYVDAVLGGVFEHARLARHEDPSMARSVVFTSSHPEICAFLNWKQPNFPVLFMINAIRLDGLHTTANRSATSVDNLRETPVCVSLEEAAHFAATNNLMGVVAPADLLSLVPSAVPATRVQGLVLVAAGDEVTPDLGVDGFFNGQVLEFPQKIDM